MPEEPQRPPPYKNTQTAPLTYTHRSQRRLQPTNASKLNPRRLPSPPPTFDPFRNTQHKFFLVRPPNHLNANRQSFRRPPNRNARPRKSRQIKPLRRTHSIAITMFRSPMVGSRAMPKRRRAR